MGAEYSEISSSLLLVPFIFYPVWGSTHSDNADENLLQTKGTTDSEEEISEYAASLLQRLDSWPGVMHIWVRPRTTPSVAVANV